jgi:hypothetical protein
MLFLLALAAPACKGRSSESKQAKPSEPISTEEIAKKKPLSPAEDTPEWVDMDGDCEAICRNALACELSNTPLDECMFICEGAEDAEQAMEAKSCLLEAENCAQMKGCEGGELVYKE